MSDIDTMTDADVVKLKRERDEWRRLAKMADSIIDSVWYGSGFSESEHQAWKAGLAAQEARPCPQ